MTMDIRKGDCLNLMKTIPDASVDLLLCDLPYGETNCKWDTVIDMEEFWKEFKRIRKSPRTACLHFCSTRFGYNLIKSWEKGYKMDMVWKKRNKTGGLQSRLRPLRNHEMIYFFYEKAPKYNRDRYHKRIKATPKKVVELTEEKKEELKKKWTAGMTDKSKGTIGYDIDGQIASGAIENRFSKEGGFNKAFEPTQPSSVIEPELYKDECYGAACGGKGFGAKSYRDKLEKEGLTMSFEPKQPASVVEDKLENVYSEKGWEQEGGFGSKEYREKLKEKGYTMYYDPRQPGSVVPETYNDDGKSAHGWDEKCSGERVKHFEPGLPVSVQEDLEDCHLDIYDFVEDAEDAPRSVFDSKRVFIGKRNHQTEKPQDILEFFIKYYTDENETILDPTMGSGSTGVACKNLKRNFIGFEMDEKIFETAKSRIEKGK